MSVSTLCEICLRNEVEHTCLRCGQLVCDSHFDERTERCDECTTETDEMPGQIPDSGDMPDGVDTYRF
jgi:hypothetical protein